MKWLIIFAFFFIITQTCLGQKNKNDSNVKYPISDATNFKDGYTANIYIHGCIPNIIITIVVVKSLDKLLSSIDKKYDSCSKTIDFLYQYSNGKRKLLKEEIIRFNKEHDKRIKIYESEEKNELKKLSSITFSSGTIYFSGSGFSSVQIIKAVDKINLKANFVRCLPGSIITFENCQYKDDNTGKLSIVSKTINLK